MFLYLPADGALFGMQCIDILSPFHKFIGALQDDLDIICKTVMDFNINCEYKLHIHSLEALLK